VGESAGGPMSLVTNIPMSSAVDDDNIVFGFIEYVSDPTSWTADGGLLSRLLEHAVYTVLALAVAAAVALPIGLVIGHTNRGSFLALNLANAARALPTLGVLIAVALLTTLGLGPVMVALVILGIPPILASTYAGIQNVDPAAVDAARGMGMTEREVLWGVEVPIALPLIFSGLRAATLQIVSTATIAAVVALGGLGRPLLDSIAIRDYPQAMAAAMLVAALAIAFDLFFAALTRVVVSPGVGGRKVTRSRG
jgi:osmoprotectant transport system permease protein